jgi:cold-inducible RNA-binding protein
MSTKTLYVGNLPYGITAEELGELFSQWGPLADIRIIEGRGFGFVELPAENAVQAVEATNGKDFGGRALTVNEARPRTERRGGGGGGRGGGGGGGRRDDRRRGW